MNASPTQIKIAATRNGHEFARRSIIATGGSRTAPTKPLPSPPGRRAHLPAFAVMGSSRECARIRPETEGGERMDFGERMTAKARARVRAFVAPRRSRVVNSGAEGGLRNPGVVVRRRGASRNPRIAGSTGATRALRPRHNENDPVFDKIRQIHAFIPQIRAFFRQIQDPSEREKNIKSLKIKWLWKQGGAGRGYFARPRRLRASARTCSAPPSRRGRSGTPRAVNQTDNRRVVGPRRQNGRLTNRPYGIDESASPSIYGAGRMSARPILRRLRPGLPPPRAARGRGGSSRGEPSGRYPPRARCRSR